MSDEANDANFDTGSQLPPMRSQSEVHLPPVEPWPEPVDGKLLLDELRHEHRRVVVMPKWADVTSSLWVVHTFAFELRRVSTYLGIESPEKECGKTTLMTLLSRLVNRPAVAANISSPAFYRAIEELRPTLLIDEADTLSPGNAQAPAVHVPPGQSQQARPSLVPPAQIPPVIAPHVPPGQLEPRGANRQNPLSFGLPTPTQAPVIQTPLGD